MAERMTERHTCSKCNGKGFIAEHGDNCCRCKTKGYLENGTGRESVCPTCNGDGFTMNNRICSECGGKGYKVYIYEITNFLQQCVSCVGTGCVDQEPVTSDFYGNRASQNTKECSVCHGRGIITDQRIKRIR